MGKKEKKRSSYITVLYYSNKRYSDDDGAKGAYSYKFPLYRRTVG
jgi:hypothetical protein